MPELITSFESQYLLGIESMDETHRQFVSLVNQLGTADKDMFIKLFHELAKHTETHFDAENILMQEKGFPAIREHKDEHLRVLGDLNRLQKKVNKGNIMMAKAFVTQQLPAWFDLHAKTMDSALAAHIKATEVSVASFS